MLPNGVPLLIDVLKNSMIAIQYYNIQGQKEVQKELFVEPVPDVEEALNSIKAFLSETTGET